VTKNYLSTVYDEESHPYGTYPEKLCFYLFKTFDFEKGMKMLEPGCGRGEFLNNFQNLGLDVVGVDLSPEALEYDNNFEVKLCDIEKEKLPFVDNSIDIIYSKSFIEHLYHPEKFLEEAYRVLKPNGVFLTLTPDWESNYKIFFDDITHRTPFTMTALEDSYKMFGFKDIKVTKFRQLPIVWRFPILNYFCALISFFIPVRTKIKFLRWSRELMLIGFGRK
tara:strand:- start:2612 stop:3274 length:663 start_codon:yes stop_codon:yes gene_type:complete